MSHISLGTRRPLLAIMTSAVLLVTLSACGSSTDSDSSANGTTPSPGAAAGAPSSPTVGDGELSAARDEYDLTLAQCLRDKGLQVADPLPGQGIQESSPEINEAAMVCMDEIGDPPVSESKVSDSELLAQSLEEAECFRNLGYEVEEPTLELTYTLPEGATDEEVAECISAMP